MATYNQNLVFNGLGTVSVTVPVTGDYFVDGILSLPMLISGGGASSVVVVVNQNGSPVYTGNAGASGFYTNLSCAANDVIAVVFSSAAAADQPFNIIKSNISIGQGQ